MRQINSADLKKIKSIEVTDNSTLFEAKLAQSEDRLVLKVPIRNPVPTETMFLEELKHPHIVALIGQVCDKPYLGSLVFEYMEGGDFKHYLREHNTPGIAAKQVAVRDSILLQTLFGLAHMHAHGVVHRDIKPGNILLRFLSPDEVIVKIADFGIAKRVDPQTKIYTSMMKTTTGTAGYIAPEVYSEKNEEGFMLYTTKVDIFAFGVVALQAGSDNLPYIYPQAGYGRAMIHSFGSRGVLPHISDEVSKATVSTWLLCFNRNPKERPTAEELIVLRTPKVVLK